MSKFTPRTTPRSGSGINLLLFVKSAHSTPAISLKIIPVPVSYSTRWQTESGIFYFTLHCIMTGFRERKIMFDENVVKKITKLIFRLATSDSRGTKPD